MPRLLKHYPSVIIDPETISDKLCFADLFGREGPVHVEIGSGKGTFIVNQAKAQPEVDFLGIEWASKYYRYAVDRVGRWALKNIRLLRTDAAVFLAEHISDQSVIRRRHRCPRKIQLRLIECRLRLQNAGILLPSFTEILNRLFKVCLGRH